MDLGKQGATTEFGAEEGLSLALSYLENPSDVACPRCGHDHIEVVCFLDARALEKGAVVPIPPDEDYTVVLYCHGCSRAAALDFSREDRREAA